MRNSKPVLLIEDDAVDAMNVQRAFRYMSLFNPLDHTTNGEGRLS